MGLQDAFGRFKAFLIGRVLFTASSMVPLAELAARGRCKIREDPSVVVWQRAVESIAGTCRSAACASLCDLALLMSKLSNSLGPAALSVSLSSHNG